MACWAAMPELPAQPQAGVSSASLFRKPTWLLACWSGDLAGQCTCVAPCEPPSSWQTGGGSQRHRKAVRLLPQVTRLSQVFLGHMPGSQSPLHVMRHRVNMCNAHLGASSHWGAYYLSSSPGPRCVLHALLDACWAKVPGCIPHLIQMTRQHDRLKLGVSLLALVLVTVAQEETSMEPGEVPCPVEVIPVPWFTINTLSV